jgi:hypothetical protein
LIAKYLDYLTGIGFLDPPVQTEDAALSLGQGKAAAGE